MSGNVIEYLEYIIAKVKDGELDIELGDTEFSRKTNIEHYQGQVFEVPGEIDDSHWTEVLKIKKPDRRILQ